MFSVGFAAFSPDAKLRSLHRVRIQLQAVLAVGLKDFNWKRKTISPLACVRYIYVMSCMCLYGVVSWLYQWYRILLHFIYSSTLARPYCSCSLSRLQYGSHCLAWNLGSVKQITSCCHRRAAGGSQVTSQQLIQLCNPCVWCAQGQISQAGLQSQTASEGGWGTGMSKHVQSAYFKLRTKRLLEHSRLVGGLEHFLSPIYQLGIVIPTECNIFFRGVAIPPTRR